MPRRTTAAPDAFARVTIFSKLVFMRAAGKPRRPSLPPNSRIITSGEKSVSAVSIRVAPPSVVSPLILALMTRCSYPCSLRRICNKAAQDWSISIPYPALRLSPKMRMVGGSALAALAVIIKIRREKIIRMSDQLSNEPNVLEAKGLSKEVSSPEGTLTILSDVSFTISAGESVAVVGPSGAGKSTLLALLAGLDLPTAGHVVLNAANLSSLDEDGRAQLRAESVGFVFQSFHLVPSLNALENVMLPLELAGQRDARSAALEIIQKVGLGERWSHYPAQLSGGEKQRVAIARAFATEPAVLFADEPTGNLDSRTGSNIMDLMFELNRSSSTTLVLVTHDQDLAERCDRILSLDVGKLISDERVAG
jgi:putative ABC transport system ATP-binding protein